MIKSFRDFISDGIELDESKLTIPSHLKACKKEALKIFKKYGLNYLKNDNYEDSPSVITWRSLFQFKQTYMEFEIFLMKDINYKYQIMLNYVTFGKLSGGLTGGSVETLAELGKALSDSQKELLNIRITE